MAARPLNDAPMPDRRFYLCSGEVADQTRRARLASLLQDHGDQLHGLVFICALNAREQEGLANAATTILDPAEDQLLFVDFGPETLNWTNGLAAIGKPWSPVIRSRIV